MRARAIKYRRPKKSKSRGNTLESHIKQRFEELEDYGFVCTKLEVKHQKQPCDFIIVGKQVWLFDAKETHSETWRLSQAEDHQVKAVKRAQALGHRAGFVVWFMETNILLGGIRWIEDLSKGKYTVHDGVPWGIDLFF